VGFEGGETITEFGCGAVEGCTREVTYRGGGRAECPAELALEDVELGIVEEAGLEGEMLPNDESSDDADSVGLCEWRAG
jgi:uncharacterized phosphosugar-binding protein